jgi:uncharacterized membrane protein
LRQRLVGIEIVQGQLTTKLGMVLPSFAKPALFSSGRTLFLSVHQHASIVEDSRITILMHGRLMLLTTSATLGAIEHLRNNYAFEPPLGQVLRREVVVRMSMMIGRNGQHFILHLILHILHFILRSIVQSR